MDEKGNKIIPETTQTPVDKTEISTRAIRSRMDPGSMDFRQISDRQNTEQLKLRARYQEQKTEVLEQTQEEIGDEKFINDMRELSYGCFGINHNLEQNTKIQNFVKGVIDELLIGNLELARKIFETNGAVILDGLGELLTIDGISKVLLGMKENFSELLFSEAYGKWKAAASIGLIGSGAGLGLYAGKKLLKKWASRLGKVEKSTSSDTGNVVKLPKKPVETGTVKNTGTTEVLSFKEGLKYNHNIPEYRLAEQAPKTANCGHINLDGALEWANGGKPLAKEAGLVHSEFSLKTGLNPRSFVDLFNKHSPDGYKMQIKHPGAEETISLIESQMTKWLPVPMIYVPVGGNVLAPHYATIVGMGKKADGTPIFRVADSMQKQIPKDWLTKEELIDALGLEKNLKTDSPLRNVALQGVAKVAKKHLGGEHTVFIIEKPVAVEKKAA